MSLNAATIAVLIAKGLTAEDLLEVARATEVKADPTNAERQARHRGKRNAVTVTETPPLIEDHNPPVSSETLVSSEDPTTPKSNGKSAPAVSPEQVVEAWNTMADGAGVPKAKLTPERRRKLSTFVRRHTIDDITEAIWAVPRSPFLCGENDRGWKAGIDFILQPSSFTKLIEGTYDRSTH